jgi:hypothetical protein
MVERVTPTVRYVSVEGPVTRMIPGTDELTLPAGSLVGYQSQRELSAVTREQAASALFPRVGDARDDTPGDTREYA